MLYFSIKEISESGFNKKLHDDKYVTAAWIYAELQRVLAKDFAMFCYEYIQ